MLADIANVNSSVLSGFATNAATFFGHIQSHTVGALVCDNLVEYSIVNKGAYRTAGTAFPITGGAISGVVGTQRRRVDRVRV